MGFSLPSHPYALGNRHPRVLKHHECSTKLVLQTLPPWLSWLLISNILAEIIKKRFRQQKRSTKSEHSRSMPLPDTWSTLSGDENTTLLRAVQAKKPLWEDDRPYVRWPANICHLAWLILASSYVNVLLIFVPLGTIAGALSWNPTAVFVLNFLAIVPLAALLTFSVEELSSKLGQTRSGLLNAMFTNAVKLIVS